MQRSSALPLVLLPCPGYCTNDDKCVCYQSSGKRPSESFAYFGADCSKSVYSRPRG